jgi:hypothetical protein
MLPLALLAEPYPRSKDKKDGREPRFVGGCRMEVLHRFEAIPKQAFPTRGVIYNSSVTH